MGIHTFLCVFNTIINGKRFVWCRGGQGNSDRPEQHKRHLHQRDRARAHEVHRCACRSRGHLWCDSRSTKLQLLKHCKTSSMHNSNAHNAPRGCAFSIDNCKRLLLQNAVALHQGNNHGSNQHLLTLIPNVSSHLIAYPVTHLHDSPSGLCSKFVLDPPTNDFTSRCARTSHTFLEAGQGEE